MSINALMQDKIARKMLFPIKPRAAGTTARRALLASEEVWTRLGADGVDEAMEARMGTLQADLEVFAEGKTIGPKYLFLLYPAAEGVWEIRSVRDDPSIRVLGLFAAKDVFVATNLALREDLGGWQSREWKAVKKIARARWNVLFHTYPPVITADVHAVVSGAIHGKYLKS